MFLVVGESLVDLISDAGSWRFEAAAGGSPLNVAVGLAAAGHPVRLASEVGDDLFGGLVREHLTRYDVDTADLVTAGAPTSLAFARLDAEGVAGYDFRFAWGWSSAPSLDGVTCLHTGSLAAVADPGAAAVRAAVTSGRARGIPVCYDPNVRPSLMGGTAAAARTIEDLVSLADIVKVSAEDLAWLYPTQPDRSAAAGWAARGPRLVVVTRGERGAVAFGQGYEVECATPDVTLVDTVGAGDAFTAGLLAGLAAADALTTLAPEAVAEALRLATATAAAVCAHRGPAPAPADLVRDLASRVTAKRRTAGP